jgi:hypothetical protein
LRIVPVTGARFTCTSKTFMKIETRGTERSAMPSSSGGLASTTFWTTPSAGLTTRPSRTGVTRSGSRKK